MKRIKNFFRNFGRRISGDGSEKVRPIDVNDFPGIKRAKKSQRTERTNEWDAREDEKRTH